MDKKNIIEKIKGINFFSDVTLILDIIAKNIDRVEFTKEGIGIENFIFMAEKGCKEFEDEPLYGCFGVNVSEENDEQNFISMKKNMNADYGYIVSKMIDVFEKTNKILYIWVAFEESSLSESDMFIVIEKMKKNKKISPFETKAKLRKYPSWYKAKTPNDILFEEKSFELLYEIQNNLEEEFKKDILSKIEQSVLNNDNEAFLLFCKQYNKILNKKSI